MIDTLIFETAYQQALLAFQKNEVPVGAVVFNPETNQIIAFAHNQTETLKDPTAHAEIMALRQACQTLNQKRLDGYALFVTLEPCAMCAGALAWARLKAVYYGAPDIKSGAIEQGALVFQQPQTHHKPFVQGGIEAEKCGALLSLFFQQKRKKKSTDSSES